MFSALFTLHTPHLMRCRQWSETYTVHNHRSGRCYKGPCSQETCNSGSVLESQERRASTFIIQKTQANSQPYCSFLKENYVLISIIMRSLAVSGQSWDFSNSQKKRKIKELRYSLWSQNTTIPLTSSHSLSLPLCHPPAPQLPLTPSAIRIRKSLHFPELTQHCLSRGNAFLSRQSQVSPLILSILIPETIFLLATVTSLFSLDYTNSISRRSIPFR